MTSSPSNRPHWPVVLLAVALIGFLGGGWWLLRETEGPTPATPSESAANEAAGESARDLDPTLDGSALEGRRTEEPSPDPLPANGGERRVLHGIVLSAVDRSPRAGATVEAFPGAAPQTPIDLRRQIQSELTVSPIAASHDLQTLDRRNDSWTRERRPRSNSRPKETARPPLATATCDENGRFKMAWPEDQPTAYFRVRGEGLTEQVSLAISEADQREVVLLVLPAARVLGQVLHADGTAARGARVAIEGNFDPMEFVSGSGTMLVGDEVQADENGRFVFDCVPTGHSYQLTALEEPFAPTTESVDVRSARDHQVRLRLEQRTRLEVSVRGSTGEPIEDASVSLLPANLDLGAVGTLGRTLPSDLRTDAEGHAVLEGLPATRWVVDVACVDWLAPPPATIDLGARSTETVEFRLDAGRVLTGRVRDDRGEPVADARLRCTRPATFTNLSSLTSRERQPWSKSTADGNFEIRGLGTDDRLTLEVRAPGHRALDVDLGPTDTYREVVLERLGVIRGIVLAGSPPAPCTEFWVEPTREEGFSFDLTALARTQWIRPRLRFSTKDGRFEIQGVEPGRWTLVVGAEGCATFKTPPFDVVGTEEGPRQICRLPPESVIEGRVLDATDRTPVAGAEVKVQTTGSNPMSQALEIFQNAPSAKSDENGAFRLAGLSAGRWTLAVRHPDYAPLSRAGIEVGVGKVTADVELLLDAGGVVFGRVLSGGVPSAGDRVFATTTTQQIGGSATSDANGWYRLEGLSPGRYVLTRMAGSFSLDSENLLAQFSSGLETHEVTVKAGDEQRVDFEGATRGAGSVRGKVSQSGQGIEGAIVSLVASGDSLSLSGGSAARTTMTDAAGAFLFEGLEPGRVLVQCQLLDHLGAMPSRMIWREVVVPERGAAEVRFDLPRGAITGRVLDAESGEPLAGVPVRALLLSAGAPSSLQGLTDQLGATASSGEDGRYQIGRLEAGRYVVVAGGRDLLGLAKARAEARSSPVDVGAGSAEVPDLRVGPGGSITGEVVDAQGAPIAGATISVRGEDGRWLHAFSMVTSSASGEFEYPGLPTGSFDVVVHSPGLATQELVGVGVRVGQASSVGRVCLLGGTTVYVDPTGIDPASFDPGAFEIFGPSGRRMSGSFGIGDLMTLLRSAGDGRRSLGTYPAGTYRLRASLGERRIDREFVLQGEPEITLTIDDL